MTRRLPFPRRGERGFVTVMLAISSFAMLLMVGFGVDLGSWMLTANKLQRAADSAALAGVVALPDSTQAQSDATAQFERNGYKNGTEGVSITTESSESTTLKTSITDADVPTYFVKLIMPKISITRSATARTGSNAPSLGSPFNVLGTGDLNIPNQLGGNLPRQNFWLAVNGACAPKEDGDMFLSRWDGNRYNNRHNCSDSETKNPNHNPAGYSYFIDIPPSPSGSSNTVALKVYDASWDDTDPNIVLSAANDYGDWVDTTYVVWEDVNDTPGDETDDVRHRVVTVTAGDDGSAPGHAGAKDGWMTIYNVPNSKIINGAKFRIQVYVLSYDDDPSSVEMTYSVNSFSLMAQRSWNTGGCDSRKVSDCPHVYGRNAMSVVNNIPNAGNVDFYLAEVDASFAGSSLKVYMWDPGEGVDKVQFIAPDGTALGSPIPFDWEASPSFAGYSGTNVTELLTAGNGPQPCCNRVGTAKFNDRLITATLRIPPDYGQKIAAADGDEYIRLRYVTNSAPSDRTTIGVTTVGGNNTLPRLMRVN
jgi:Flp pilus assembly protein TadG